MQVEYFYCNSCSYEATNIFVKFSRSVANGDLCKCPKCNEENFIDDEE